jgi:Succinylglutamate desuccinylase / Aspartoacylase family
MPNRLPFAAAMLVAACLTTAACTQLRQLKRFFLTRCPEDGPHREQEFDIHLEPVDVDRYYHDLSTAAAGMAARPVTNVDYKGETYAVHDVGPIGAEGATSIVVLAGVHGNEIAGALAAPAILQDVRSRRDDYRGVRIHVVAPVNPVGLRYGSRYNADGCDINRDFREFGTAEARVIRDVLMEAKPHLILSLHEGPHDGFFVIATRSMPEEVARAAAASIPADVMPLATENNLRLDVRDARCNAGRLVRHRGEDALPNRQPRCLWRGAWRAGTHDRRPLELARCQRKSAGSGAGGSGCRSLLHSRRAVATVTRGDSVLDRSCQGSTFMTLADGPRRAWSRLRCGPAGIALGGNQEKSSRDHP